MAKPNDGTRTQFEWFVTLWVMAFSYHFFETRPIQALPVVLAGIPCLAMPGSIAAFAIFLAVGAWTVIIDLPATANHFVLALIIHVTFAVSAVCIVSRRDETIARSSDFRARWIEVTRSPAGLTLLVVYFFAVFHKLNSSFFDAEVSCAGTLLRQVFSLQGLDGVSIPDSVVVASAWLTIVLEGLMVLFVAVPRWRRWGLIVAVTFHGGLALAQFYDFATFALALYLLLLPPQVFERLPRPERLRRIAVAGWSASAAVSVGAWSSSASPNPATLTWHTLQVATWLLAVLPLLLPLCRASFGVVGAAPAPPWRFRPLVLVVFPVIAFVNGATPYLGWKTVSNYSMFSNLRTEEGRTNHLIQGVAALEISNYLRDTVDIKAIDVPIPPRLPWFHRGLELAGSWVTGRPSPYRWRRQLRWTGEEIMRVPWIELRRAVLVWKEAGLHGIRLRFSHDGVEREVLDVVSDAELAAPLPFWTRRLLAFRAIQPDNGPVSCRW